MKLQYNQSQLQKSQLVADVHVSKDLDNIVIFPRKKAERLLIRTALRKAYPNITFSMFNGGLTLSPLEAILVFNNVCSINLQWSIEAKQFVDNQSETRRAYVDVKTTINKIKEEGDLLAKEMLKDNDISTLDNHQIVNVAAMTVPNGFGLCVFDEQGAGKTVTTIYAYDVLVKRNEVDIALIVAPKSMVGEWPKDIKRFKNDLYKISTISGSPSEKRVALSSNADIYITNYETTVNMEVELTALLRKYRKRCILVVDESFFIKNPDSKRTQSLRRLRGWCGRAFVLCGTPAPNSPADLVEQFNFVDLGLTFEDVDLPDDRIQALPIVRNAINERGLYLRHLKQDVLPDLPDKRFHTIYVPMAQEQKQIYQQTLQGYIRDLNSIDEDSFRKQITHFLAKRSALLQICSNPSSVVSNYNEIPAKQLVLDEILEDLINIKGEKVVLWSYYRHSIEALFKRYSKYKPVRYDGSVTSIEERKNGVNSFQQADSPSRLFIGNPAAAGAGLTLHQAKFAIYESFSDQAAHYLQSLDRIHRRGQVKDVDYIILLADKSIEVKQYQTLQTKEVAARNLLGDIINEPYSRDLLLNEAIGAAKALRIEI